MQFIRRQLSELFLLPFEEEFVSVRGNCCNKCGESM